MKPTTTGGGVADEQEHTLRREMAGLLLDAGCVSARTDEPFRLPSGWASPVYMDCRRLISFPAIRSALLAQARRQLDAAGALDGLRAVAGGEASGIALAAWIADALELPLQYVRKKPRGLTQVEGVVQPGAPVLLVDDMMAAGQSKLAFLQGLRSAGAEVRDLFVVFSYGTFGAEQLLAAQGVRTHALCSWREVLDVASARNALPPASLEEMRNFVQDPARWSIAHGGVGATAAPAPQLLQRQLP
ncbi:orotate phosphoribosyltransferase [Variovorax sp.]|uniref:orotate phosphoribosyltransferase n=1 Tax=Variovorax sp. TaxID=1871043 RepID=UPI002D27F058|nr:phosphoribosyltransferase family protein [Variovorax sp.]HYP85202.1 phosphoribosyltransferase family protein [Variovorax sp.]